MKADLGAGIACRQAVADKITGQWTFVGCIDRVHAVRLPCVQQGFSLAIRLDLNEPAAEDTSFEVRFIRDDGETATELGSPTLTIPAGNACGWTWMTFQFLRLTKEGTVTFRAKWRRSGAGPWRHGKVAAVQVRLLPLEDEVREQVVLALDSLPPVG